MKRIYNSAQLLIVLLIALLVGSCKKELNKSPLDEFDKATFWTTEDNAMLALAAVYRGSLAVNGGDANPHGWWSYQGLVFLEQASDNAYQGQGDNNAFNRLSIGTLTSSLGILLQYWSPSYQSVARCNDFGKH